PNGPERTGTRRLFFFDVIENQDGDVRGWPLEARRAHLEEIVGAMVWTDGSPRVHLVVQADTGISAWYVDLLSRGGEGLVAKRRGSTALPRTSDGKIDAWVRIKPAHTVDYVIIGQGI